MGSIARRPEGRWRGRYRDAQGREHARHFTRKVDAQKWLDAITTSVNTGAYVDPNLAATTIADWAPRWLETKTNLKATTRAAYEVLLRHHVLPAWGTQRLAEVTHEGVGRWVGELQDKRLSASTIRQTHLFADQLDEVADALDRARTAADQRDVKQSLADHLRTNYGIPHPGSRDQMLPGLDFPGL